MEPSIGMALAWAVRNRPYYTVAINALTPVPAKGLGTFGVDKHWRLYYDPEILEVWDLPTQGVGILHELGHLLRDHAARCGERDHRQWNLAGDAEINDDLLDEGLDLLSTDVVPSTLGQRDGLLAEDYYRALDQDQADARPKPGCAGGSGVTGRPEPWEKPGPSTAGAPTGLEAHEADTVRAQVAQDIKKVAEVRGRGSLPSGVLAWADATLEPPKVDWRRILASIVRRTGAIARGRSDYTYRRPHRRQASLPTGSALRPASITREAKIGIVLDTSASVSVRDLEDALREIEGICRAAAVPVVMVSCDVRAHKQRAVRRASQVEIVGRGGTDLRHGIRSAEAEHVDLLIVLTDGHTPWPPATRAPLVVGLVGDHRCRPEKVPEWATAIEVDRV